LSSFLKEGMTLGNFQSDGNLQVRKDYLNRILRGKHIVSEVAFSITIPPLYNGSTGELVYEDKAKTDLLNQYFCSITSINDSNREPPNVVPRTHAILSNIDVNIQDVKDIHQTLQIGV
jgi:hypothetical protein